MASLDGRGAPQVRHRVGLDIQPLGQPPDGRDLIAYVNIEVRSPVNAELVACLVRFVVPDADHAGMVGAALIIIAVTPRGMIEREVVRTGCRLFDLDFAAEAFGLPPDRLNGLAYRGHRIVSVVRGRGHTRPARRVRRRGAAGN